MILTGKKPDENSDFDEIGTCVSQILLGSYYQLSYEATCWTQGTFQRVLLSCGGIWYNSEIYFIINCSFLIDEKKKFQSQFSQWSDYIIILALW